MAENIDDIHIEYVEDDVVIIKENEKHVLSRGSWTTIMFLYQELDKKTGSLDLKRFQSDVTKKEMVFIRQQSKFNISSAKQAKAITAKLHGVVPRRTCLVKKH